MMTTQELVDWARACHPNVSIHAYDAVWRRFIKHIVPHPDVCLVFYIKDHRLFPVTDERIKVVATKANHGGTDNLWKYMNEMKWNRHHDKFVVLNNLEEEEELDVSNNVVVLPPDTKIEPVIDRYMVRTNYYVEYLHFDNNGRV